VRLAGDQPPAVLAARLRDESWERIGYGVYLPTAVDPADPRRRVLAQIEGARRRSRAPVVFSHLSAAALWGLTLWRVPQQVHLLHPSRAGGGGPGIVRHHAALPDADVTELAGVLVTSLARTVVDCTRLLGPLGGLVVADSGRAAGADPAELAERVERLRGGRHVRRARAVLSLADPGPESPYESASRFVVLRDGLPVPETQCEVGTREGTAWVDWGWPELRLLAEYDGRVKYAADPQAFIREKRRHDAIVETGQRLLRFTQEDVRGPTITHRILPLLPERVRRAVSPRADLMT
jgi:hypothetical protein